MSSFKKTDPTRHTSLISKAIVHIDFIYGVGIHNVKLKSNPTVTQGETEKRSHCHRARVAERAKAGFRRSGKQLS